MPPVEQAAVHLHLVDRDILDILISGARQRVRNGSSDLLIKDGKMHITGLSVQDQTAAIHTQVEGPVESALALLKEPRLHLIGEHPIALKVAGGDVSAILAFQFPLDSNMQIDDLQLHVDAHLKRIRVLDVAGGRELTDGVFELGVDKDGLNLKGQGTLAAIPIMLEGTMDFSSGPPDQIVQKIVVNGQPDAMQLDAAGLHVTDVLSGSLPMTAVVVERRNGEGSIALTADLTPATVSVAPLAWNKPPTIAAIASGTVLTSRGRLTKIDRISVNGNGLLLTGTAAFSDGRLRSGPLENIRLGQTQAHGTIHVLANEPIAIVLQGDQIDLALKLTEKTLSGDRANDIRTSAPKWKLDARFDRAVLANDVRATNLLMKATGVGDQIRLLDVIGSTSANAGFSIKIEFCHRQTSSTGRCKGRWKLLSRR